MKNLIFLIVGLSIGCVSLPVSKEVHVNSEPKIIIYQGMWQSDNISGDLYVNGFVIASFRGSQSFGTSPLNPFLTGKNEIIAEVRKADISQPAHLSFGISKLERGDIAATSERGNLVSLELTDNHLKGSEVLKTGRKFESDLDFSRNLSETDEVSEKEVVEYAKQIYDLFEAKDAAGLLKEFKIKIGDYAKAYSSDHIAEEFESYLKGDLLPGKLEKINFNNLKAKKSGPNGKLWQVFEGDKEFIRITSADGSLNEMSLYIGKIGGKLQVVR